MEDSDFIEPTNRKRDNNSKFYNKDQQLSENVNF